MLLLLPLVVGCSKQPELMPMKIGSQTSYVVRYGLDSKVEPVKVVREVPIAGVTGYELAGPLGVSRLAWKDGVLLAAATTNARFDPPIPLLAVDGKDRTWSGTVESLGKKQAATATLVHKSEKIELISKKVDTTLSTLTLSLPKGTVELSSWFQSGVGLVQQEQRTGPVVVVRLEMVRRPN